jgi:hypothetical protein
VAYSACQLGPSVSYWFQWWVGPLHKVLYTNQDLPTLVKALHARMSYGDTSESTDLQAPCACSFLAHRTPSTINKSKKNKAPCACSFLASLFSGWCDSAHALERAFDRLISCCNRRIDRHGISWLTPPAGACCRRIDRRARRLRRPAPRGTGGRGRAEEAAAATR